MKSTRLPRKARAKRPWKIQRLIKGVFYPKIPYGLTSRKAAKEWGERFGGRWADAYENLLRRYEALPGVGGRIPTLTGKYVRKKMQLGSALSMLGRKGWKDRTRRAFTEIVGMRREPLYPVAMIPLQVGKYERRAASMEKSISRLFRAYTGEFEFYDFAVKEIGKDEKKLGEYGKKLAAFKASLSTSSGDEAEARRLRNIRQDLDLMEMHIYDAKLRLGATRMGIAQKRETAKWALSKIKASGHYGALHYGPKHEKPYLTGKKEE